MNYIEPWQVRGAGLGQITLRRSPPVGIPGLTSKFESGLPKPNDLHFPGPPADLEQGECHRQLKAARPGAPWVQVQDSRIEALLDLVGVAADYRIESRSLGFQVEIAEIVEHIEMESQGFDDSGHREFLGPGLSVHIPAHGKHGSNAFELGEDFGRPDISSVNDELHPGQGV